MVNTKKLESAIERTGKTKKHLAKQLDMSAPSLYNKINGLSDFSRPEVIVLAQELNLSEAERIEILGE